MTTEYIKRVCNLLLSCEIDFIITGGLAKVVRNEKKSTGDIDVVFNMRASNLEKIRLLEHKLSIAEYSISKILKDGQIVQLKIFPFTIDILPYLDGLTNDQIFKSKEIVNFCNLNLPIIGKAQLKTNLNTVKARYNGLSL